MLATQPGKASYGAEEVMKNLEMGVVDVLLLSEDLDDNTIQRYEDEGKKTNVDIRLISTETREGVQLRDMGKIAAILRYEVSH